MRYPRPEHLREMAAAGYDPQLLAERQAQCDVAEAVRRRIREAFRTVRLEDGIGLFEAQVIDDYGSDAERAKARSADEKHDWTLLSRNDLRICHSSLSFFDAKGMRFHLPAFMLADIDGEFGFNLSFHLALDLEPHDRFALLDDRQRDAVRTLLVLMRHDPDHEFEREHIVRALEGYWRA